MAGTHVEREDHPWKRIIEDHPARTETPGYVRSRRTMHELAAESRGTMSLYIGDGDGKDAQCHHGGGLTVWEQDDPVKGRPFLLLNLIGVEYSAQYGMDPARCDDLRANAVRLYVMFPHSLDEIDRRVPGSREILETPITDAQGIAAYVDSPFNASVPLPAPIHTGTLESRPPSASIHHYPWPIAPLPLISYPDLQVFVPDSKGQHVAVAPIAPRGSGDGRVEVVWTPPTSPLHRSHRAAHGRGERLILAPDHPLARQAFARQR